jgi:hypothetical protein
VNKSIEPEVLPGRLPTPEEEFFLDWGKQAYQTSLESVNTTLRELVAINAVLFGGSLAFFDEKAFNTSFRIPATLFFLLSFVIGFFGLLPWEEKIFLNMPNQIQHVYNRLVQKKWTALLASGGLLIVGLLLVLLGVILKKQ